MTQRVFLLLTVIVCAYSRIQELNQWTMQASSSVPDRGSAISIPGYNDASWYKVQTPATVMAGILQNENYDPFYGQNLKNISSTPFNVPWWYRIEFNLPSGESGKSVVVTFKGINYRADVWCNGHQIGNSSDVVGTMRYFDFDLTSIATFGGQNAIAIQISRPIDDVFGEKTDLAISFIDWSPNPPDSSMGLWREVELQVFDGPILVRYPSVISKLAFPIPTETGASAHLTVLAELANFGSSSVSGTFIVDIPLLGKYTKSVTVNSKQVADFSLEFDTNDATVWWPWQMGVPYLYNMTVTFVSSSSVSSDPCFTYFGIREVESPLDDRKERLYLVNGQKIMIRGGGWTPDLFLRSTPEYTRSEFDYMMDMGLNSVRLEGKFPDDYYFDYADNYGILVMIGWACCDAWQEWDNWGDEQMLVAAESLRSQLKRLRTHPSMLVFLYGSDERAPPNVERPTLEIFKETSWQNCILSSAANRTSTITGPSGVKMSGPYSWVPPHYFYNMLLGGAFGLLTEGGPGEMPLTLESFSRVIPSNNFWPMNSYWDWHCGNPKGVFHNLRFLTQPLNARMGEAQSAQEYLLKSQVMGYEGHRAMFEAYNANKYISKGVIQWMLNNAWPEMIWHLYDYFLNQGGSYFGTKKACESLHVQYNYNTRGITIVNSLYRPYPASPGSPLEATADVYSIAGQKLYSGTGSVVSPVPSDGVLNNVIVIPNSIPGVGKTYFLHLTLKTGNTVISRNTYWLSTEADVLDYSQSTFYNTPCTSYADFTALQQLPAVTLSTEITFANNGTKQTATVSVRNPANYVAFFIRLRIVRSDNGADILPVFWSDNMFSLMPQESTVVTATYNAPQVSAKLIVEVWNGNK